MDKKQVSIIIFSTMISLGGILFVNRYIKPFLPSESWRILLDHFVAGFLIPLGIFILILGILLFLFPKTKVIYKNKSFIIPTAASLLILLLWEVQNGFGDLDQIALELLGIITSWIYFIYHKKT